MIPIVQEKLEAYAEAHSEAVSGVLQELRKETFAKMEGATMQVGRLEGDFLRLLARLVQAKRILELGMFTGYSALMMAEALPDDGELITCDVNPKAEEMARRYFAQSPHGKKIQVRMGPGLETIRALRGPFDLVFIDADKQNLSAYYDAVFPLVRQGGLIVVDNTLWSGKVLEPEDADTRAIVALNKKVASDDRVEKVLVTVRDGMMLAYKR
jgi:caffeoyl-CoA O-methyltransferase